jgi:light-regulated signal transduction histidine kinase (bacteriophytochrome)
MTDLKNIFHAFGINSLLNASTSGLILFKKINGEDSDAERAVCSIENPAALILTGHDVMEGKKWSELIGYVGVDSVDIDNQDFEKYFALSKTWCRISNRPIDEHHFLCTVTDISSIKGIQSELERKIDDLNKSNADLEQFAYVASHDLQEPLRKIVSFGERLDVKSRDILNEEQALYLDRILNSTRRMQMMIENLLEFSRVARAKDDFVQTDLNVILRNTVSDLELLIQKKDAIVTIEPLPAIDAIPVQMAQLFQNLLSNSLKFTRSDVRPEVRVSARVLSSDEVRSIGGFTGIKYVKIEVSDNGVGFEMSESNKIFTLFQRLRGRSEFEGAGIGLAVCKKVVENHKGFISAEGIPDEGAIFKLILPTKQG